MFEAEESLRFQKRYENGYDLLHDVKYNYWKKSSQVLTSGGMWTAYCIYIHIFHFALNYFIQIMPIYLAYQEKVNQ